MSSMKTDFSSEKGAKKMGVGGRRGHRDMQTLASFEKDGLCVTSSIARGPHVLLGKTGRQGLGVSGCLLNGHMSKFKVKISSTSESHLTCLCIMQLLTVETSYELVGRTGKIRLRPVTRENFTFDSNLEMIL